MCYLCDDLINAVKEENINECERIWKNLKSDEQKNSSCIKWAPRDILIKCYDSLSYKFYLELQFIGIIL
jgi:hypothetical protein